MKITKDKKHSLKMGHFKCLHVSTNDIDNIGNVEMHAKEI
jgi:hypothetical protein